MGFQNVQFPPEIARGARGGPGFLTTVITADSGAEQRLSRWKTARHEYDVSYGIKDAATLSAAKAFFMAARGSFNSFRFKDWSDFKTSADGAAGTVTSTDQLLGVGDGVTKAFRMKKRYTSGGFVTERPLTKLVSGTVLMSQDDVTDATSTYTSSDSTGWVYYDTAPAVGKVIKGGCEFDDHVRFEDGTGEHFGIVMDWKDYGSIPSIGLVEVPDESELPGLFHMGGSRKLRGHHSRSGDHGC